MDRKKEIINALNSIAGKYSSYEVFTDWVRCMAMAISNSSTFFHDAVWQEREKAYINTMTKYSKEERMKLCEMVAWLCETMEDNPDDVLGDIYMSAGMGSKAAGQFFTPFHLSVLTARLSLEHIISSFNARMTKITINEPTCGGGGMIIGAAKVLDEAGIDYQRWMDVVAQDLDWKGVYMCYVQLSLLGISAICVQGDTLINPYVPGVTDESHILRTPRKMGLLV